MQENAAPVYLVLWSVERKSLGGRSSSYMLVEGTLKSRTYEKEGVEHRKWEVRATRLGLLDRKEKADASAAVPEGEPQAPAAEDAIPF